MIKIYTCADKRPDFIGLQLKSLYKFIDDDFEYIVINNGSNPLLRIQIDFICRLLNIKCIHAPIKWYKDACYACGIPLQWTYLQFIINDDFAMIIDSDIFAIAKVNARRFLKNAVIAGVKQQRGEITYLWNGILYLRNLPDRKNFNLMPGSINNTNVDVGGMLYHWIKANNPQIKYIPHTSHITKANKNLIYLPSKIRSEYKDEYTFEIINNQFLHYSRGSNWNLESSAYHDKKTALLRKFVEGKLNGTL